MANQTSKPPTAQFKPGDVVKLGPNDPTPVLAAVQPPTVGRIVHFKAPNYFDWQAAIVTGVQPDGSVNLKVFADEAPIVGFAGVKHEDAKEPRRWRWPPRA